MPTLVVKTEGGMVPKEPGTKLVLEKGGLRSVPDGNAPSEKAGPLTKIVRMLVRMLR